MKVLLLVLVLGSVAFCQTGNISGKVLAKYSNDVFIGAGLHLEGTRIVTVTDKDAIYKIDNVKPANMSCAVNILDIQPKWILLL